MFLIVQDMHFRVQIYSPTLEKKYILFVTFKVVRFTFLKRFN